MANPEHLAILKQGVEVWNKWRKENPFTQPDLSEANFSKARLSEIDLSLANLSLTNFQEANLSLAYIMGADLSQTNLNWANLSQADLHNASLTGANLSFADLRGAYLRGANLSHANMKHADLERSHLIETNLADADLYGVRVYGISAWDLNLNGTLQSNLIITPKYESDITVDNLEIAQFVYMLLHNAKIRDVIDTIGKKAVLILGRFTEERKAVLEAIREELRRRDYIPILFDFEKPDSRNLTETVVTLAHLSRFIIADITDAKSIIHELGVIAPNLHSVAIQPIILAGQHEYALFEHIKDFQWVLPVHQYQDADELIAALAEKVINPAEAKAEEMRPAG